MEKYLTPDGQIKCPKCGQVQPVSEVCVSCDIYFKKYEVSLRRKEERKIKQRAMEKSEKAYIQADCNKEDIKKAVKEFLVLDEVLVAAFSWIFDPREHTFPYFKPGTLSKNYLLLTNKGNLVFWAPWVEKGHAIIPSKSISEFKTKQKLFGNGVIYLYAKENLKASFNVLDLEKAKNYIGHFIKCGGDITIKEAPQEPQEKEKEKDQVTLDSNTKLELEKPARTPKSDDPEKNLAGKKKAKPSAPKRSKGSRDEPQNIGLIGGLFIIILSIWITYKVFNPKVYKSTIPGMSDEIYTECIERGEFVMEAKRLYSGEDWENAYDRWRGLCGLENNPALWKVNNPPASPLDWAKLGE